MEKLKWPTYLLESWYSFIQSEQSHAEFKIATQLNEKKFEWPEGAD